MDENLWRVIQIFMWIIGIQTTIIIAVLGAIWSSINKKFDAIDKRFELVDKRFESVDKRFESLEKRIEKVQGDITNMDKRLFGIETMLHMKDCCILKDSSQNKKAE